MRSSTSTSTLRGGRERAGSSASIASSTTASVLAGTGRASSSTSTTTTVQVGVRLKPCADASRTPFVFAEERAVRVESPISQQFRDYAFDYVFDAGSTNEQVAQQFVGQLVTQVASGDTGAVLCYGQTGSGKTHTMGLESGQAEGVMPYCLSELLRRADPHSDLRGCGARGAAALEVRLEFLQVYLDQVYDLFCAGKKLQLREVPQLGVMVEGSTLVEVDSYEDASEILELALRNRYVGEVHLRTSAGTPLAQYAGKLLQPETHSSQLAQADELALLGLTKHMSSRSHVLLTLHVRPRAAPAAAKWEDGGGYTQQNVSAAPPPSGGSVKNMGSATSCPSQPPSSRASLASASGHRAGDDTSAEDNAANLAATEPENYDHLVETGSVASGYNTLATDAINAATENGINTSTHHDMRSRKGKQEPPAKWSRLVLVDLAGSERSNVGAGLLGERHHERKLTEAKSINASLAALGNVVNSLSQAKKAHIPWRESKLTKLLWDAIRYPSHVKILCTVAREQHAVSETVSTLGFASRCKKIVQRRPSRVGNLVDGRAGGGSGSGEEVNLLRAEVFKLREEKSQLQQMVESLALYNNQQEPQPGAAAAGGGATSSTASGRWCTSRAQANEEEAAGEMLRRIQPCESSTSGSISTEEILTNRARHIRRSSTNRRAEVARLAPAETDAGLDEKEEEQNTSRTTQATNPNSTLNKTLELNVGKTLLLEEQPASSMPTHLQPSPLSSPNQRTLLEDDVAGSSAALFLTSPPSPRTERSNSGPAPTMILAGHSCTTSSTTTTAAAPNYIKFKEVEVAAMATATASASAASSSVGPSDPKAFVSQFLDAVEVATSSDPSSLANLPALPPGILPDDLSSKAQQVLDEVRGLRQYAAWQKNLSEDLIKHCAMSTMERKASTPWIRSPRVPSAGGTPLHQYHPAAHAHPLPVAANGTGMAHNLSVASMLRGAAAAEPFSTPNPATVKNLLHLSTSAQTVVPGTVLPRSSTSTGGGAMSSESRQINPSASNCRAGGRATMHRLPSFDLGRTCSEDTTGTTTTTGQPAAVSSECKRTGEQFISPPLRENTTEDDKDDTSQQVAGDVVREQGFLSVELKRAFSASSSSTKIGAKITEEPILMTAPPPDLGTGQSQFDSSARSRIDDKKNAAEKENGKTTSGEWEREGPRAQKMAPEQCEQEQFLDLEKMTKHLDVVIERRTKAGKTRFTPYSVEPTPELVRSEELSDDAAAVVSISGSFGDETALSGVVPSGATAAERNKKAAHAELFDDATVKIKPRGGGARLGRGDEDHLQQSACRESDEAPEGSQESNTKQVLLPPRRALPSLDVLHAMLASSTSTADRNKFSPQKRSYGPQNTTAAVAAAGTSYSGGGRATAVPVPFSEAQADPPSTFHTSSTNATKVASTRAGPPRPLPRLKLDLQATTKRMRSTSRGGSTSNAT
ncbi:unnamed protein product [Amoebophrya sp. A120]|nr:unnamed protein product [Amoebophrya sp. A120]|eukprot:GSA120T00015223001.1